MLARQVDWSSKESVRQSYWFKGYRESIKGQIKVLCQMQIQHGHAKSPPPSHPPPPQEAAGSGQLSHQQHAQQQQQHQE